MSEQNNWMIFSVLVLVGAFLFSSFSGTTGQVPAAQERWGYDRFEAGEREAAKVGQDILRRGVAADPLDPVAGTGYAGKNRINCPKGYVQLPKENRCVKGYVGAYTGRDEVVAIYVSPSGSNIEVQGAAIVSCPEGSVPVRTTAAGFIGECAYGYRTGESRENRRNVIVGNPYG